MATKPNPDFENRKYPQRSGRPIAALDRRFRTVPKRSGRCPAPRHARAVSSYRVKGCEGRFANTRHARARVYVDNLQRVHMGSHSLINLMFSIWAETDPSVSFARVATDEPTTFECLNEIFLRTDLLAALRLVSLPRLE